MAKNDIKDYDTTAANNTDINSVNIAEGCAPSGINNAIRELMADLKNALFAKINVTADTSAGDDAAIGYTAAEGLILTGQGSTNDVTIKNDADADVITIATGTTNVNIVGALTAASYGGITEANLLDKTATEAVTGQYTFTAPILGTPASGVATNLTGTAAGLTAGNVTTNANLTGHITSVGNAAVLGSFTSLQLKTAISDETGSGAAVFATSPTLVTPALGTPASGVATNITGLPAASVLAGTLGTGAYTISGSLAVDNITINAAVISSDTGAISFSNENLTTTGTLAAGVTTLTGGLTVSGLTEAGSIYLEDASTSAPSPAFKAIGQRSDANISQSFSGKLALARNTTSAALVDNTIMGTIYFGGNHTDGSIANVLYSSSISAEAEGTFSDSTTMPSGLVFFTGSTGRAISTSNVTAGTERMRISNTGAVSITGTLAAGATTVTGDLTVSAGFINLGTAVELTISGGAVTATGSNHTIDTEADAASDDLDNINGDTDGDTIKIRPVNDARTVVARHAGGGGNLRLTDGASSTMDSVNDVIVMLNNGTNWLDERGNAGT